MPSGHWHFSGPDPPAPADSSLCLGARGGRQSGPSSVLIPQHQRALCASPLPLPSSTCRVRVSMCPCVREWEGELTALSAVGSPRRQSQGLRLAGLTTKTLLLISGQNSRRTWPPPGWLWSVLGVWDSGVCCERWRHCELPAAEPSPSQAQRLTGHFLGWHQAQGWVLGFPGRGLPCPGGSQSRSRDTGVN